MDKVCVRVDEVKEFVDKAFAPLVERVDRHGTALAEHEEHIEALGQHAEAQAAALEQMRIAMKELRSAQTPEAETLQEVRREMAIPADALPPPMTRAARGCDRVGKPHVLQANASALFSAI